MKKKVLLLSTLLMSQLIAQDNTFFIGANLGLSSYDYSKKDIKGSVNMSDLDSSAFLLDTEFGYKFSDEIFTTLNYQRVNFSEVNFNNYYLSLNYKFSDIGYGYKPYAGIIYGKSQMKWDKSPISSVINDSSASSDMYGLQIGAKYSLADSIDLTATYQYIKIDHQTDLSVLGSTSEIQNNYLGNLMLGFRYSF